MIKTIIRIQLMLLLTGFSFGCYSSDIYQTIDSEGHITFSSSVPQNSRIIKTVKVKNLIKKISVIQGAAAQNIKIKNITKKLSETRIQRSKKRNEISTNYLDEIQEIRHQRQIELQKLGSDKNEFRQKLSNNEKIKQSIRRKFSPLK